MWNRAHGRGVTSFPRVASHFPSLFNPLEANHKADMFVEDIPLAVMPIGGRSDRVPNFNVAIEGNSEDMERTVAILTLLTEYDRHGREELLSDAIEGIAKRLAREGVATYEIVKSEENDGCYFLHSFTSKRLSHVFGKYIQVIPKADREQWGKAYVVIPERDIWEISMPSILGGRRGYRGILRRLKKLSPFAPPFWQKALVKQTAPAYFDSQFYHKEIETLCAKITARWGWNQRDYSQENMNEFYKYYRIIRFNWAQAILREHILRELNKLLTRTGIRAKIVMEGLPTPSEILEVQEEMLKGRISFEDAHNKCSV